MADIQAKRKTSVSATETFRLDGTPQNVDSGLPTLTLTKPDGTAYTPLPTVLDTWTGPPARTTGQYRFILPGQPEVTWLDYTLTGTIGGQAQTLEGRVEWVGDLLFTLDEAKTWDGGAIPAAGVTDNQILAKRVWLLDDLERAHRCNVAFVPRFTRETHSARGWDLPLWHKRATKLLSVTVNGVAQDVAGYTLDPAGILRPTSNYTYGLPIRSGIANVVVEYVRGWGSCPGPVTEAALRITRATLVPSNIGDRATSITSDAGTILLATAGRGAYQPYGIPLADSVLAAYRAPLAA